MKMSIMNRVGNSIARKGSWVSVKVQKHAPEIYLGLGIVSFVGTVVAACSATMKAEEVIDRHNKRMEQAKEAEKVAEPEDHFDIREEKTAIYVSTAKDMVKLYGLSAALGGLTIGFILKSYNVLNGRYIGAVAAFNGVSELFRNAHERMTDEMGEEAADYYCYGVKKETSEKKVKDPETGEEKVVKEVNKKVSGDSISMELTYRYFDQTNPNWDENPTFTLKFLRGTQNMLNDLKDSRPTKHLFLNEVYDALGFEHTPLGATLGWIDSKVDFGLDDRDDPHVRMFINGKEDVFLLKFNPDGIIWDKI